MKIKLVVLTLYKLLSELVNKWYQIVQIFLFLFELN